MDWGSEPMDDTTAAVEPPIQWAADAIIDSVEAREFVVPLPRPVRNGTALITERGYVIVTIRSASGAIGTACAFTRGVPIATVIRDMIAPRIIGRSAFDIQRIWHDVYSAGELFFGRSGVFPRALSLVDIALWDLHGILLDRPLSAVLGGTGASVPVLMALGYYQSGDELGMLRREYSTLVEQGFRRFKMMAGGAPVKRDIARASAVASVLPSDATLAIDVNGTWSSAEEALRFIDALPLEIDFIEDPFRPDNRGALAAFRRSSRTPVAVGEWDSGRRSFRSLLEDDLADIVRIDATAAGGISEWLKIAAVAGAFDKRILPHYFPEIHVHLAAATPEAEAIEVVPTITGADNFEQLVVSTSWSEQPHTEPGPGAGLGIQWDWEAIEHFMK